jgi:sugar/nucleoside kinase (ribokinase family)
MSCQNQTARDYAVYVGDVALDEYYRTPRWPSVADKVEVETLEAIPGGMIANAACVYAALGGQVKFCTVLRHSPITELLLKDLEQSGVDTSMTIYDDTLPDSKTMIFLCGGEHTVFIPTLHIDTIEFTPEQFEVLRGAKYLYSTVGCLKCITCRGKTWKELAPELRESGVKVVVDYDVDYERDGDTSRFRNVDIGFFNETGFDSVRQGKSYEEAVRMLQDLGMRTVVVTLAENGCEIHSGDECFRLPARKTEVVDVTGAGDTFCSSFISVLDEMGPEQAGRFANTAASLCVSKLGARGGAVKKEEVLKLLWN